VLMIVRYTASHTLVLRKRVFSLFRSCLKLSVLHIRSGEDVYIMTT